jgi:L-ascorbate metabolism protein UlaG (beta-lactamase superfamily)
MSTFDGNPHAGNGRGRPLRDVGADLAEPARRLTLTWLGHAGVLVDTGSWYVLVDPFLSPTPERVAPPPDARRFAAGIDLVLVTHEHPHHLDLGFLELVAECSPQAELVLPGDAVPLVEGVVPADRVVSVAAGDVVSLGEDVSILVVPACHGSDAEDAYYCNDLRFVGYVIRTLGASVYHAGDTIPSPQIVAALAGERVDVAILPVNGRDAYREADGIVGNLDPREAVRLAAEVGASTLVPVHWDAIAGDGERPGRVVDEAAAAGLPVTVLVPAPGLPIPV